jgi:hypothetical protein
MEKFLCFSVFSAVLWASCTTKNNSEFKLIGTRTEQASTIDSTKILLYACAENMTKHR